MAPLITHDAGRWSFALLNENTLAADSVALLIPGDGEGRGILGRSADVDLSGYSGPMCLHSREVMTKGKHE